MKRRVPFVLAAVAAVFVASLLSCSPSIPKYELPYAEMRAKFPNGLRLVVMPDDSTPLVQVDIRYNTGSDQDPPGKAGIAHFAEHMMFQYRIFGEDKPPLFDIIPQITTGFNAYTAPDTTHYYLQGRKDELVTFIRLEAARMAADCRKIPLEEFEREREVVRNELRQRYGRPEAEIPRIIHEEAFPAGHPYHYLGIGDDEQLASVTLEDVCQFLDKYYVPQNATMIVAGNVDPDVVKNEVAFAFGEIKKGTGPDGKPTPVLADPVPLAQLSHHTVVKELPVERDFVNVVWALPPAFSEQGEHINSLMFAMTSMVSGFASDYDFATQVRPQFLGGYEAPLFVLTVELKSRGKLDEALDFIWKAAAQAHRPFESGNYQESKNLQKGQVIADIEDLGSRTNQVADLIQFRAGFDWDSEDAYLINELKRIDTVDPGDARSFIKKTLAKDKALVVVIKSNKEAEGFKKADLEFSTKSHDREVDPVVNPAEAKRPLVVPKEDSALAQAHRFELGNGMKVVMLPEGKMPVVSMRLIFAAGSAQEPEGKEGISDLAASFLNHPRGSEIYRIGASWGGFADEDTTTFTAHGISIYTPKMIEGLERKIKIGDYSQEQLESWQKRQRQQFESRAFRQNRAFRRELGLAVYGPSHPYATRGSVTKSSIGKMGRDELFAFKSKHYTAKNATLIVAGNFDAAAAERAIRETFGAWEGGRKDEPVTEVAAASQSARAIGVIGDKLPQVQVAISFPGPRGVDGQEAARRVLAEMISLKMGEIRTELGSTYGVGAYRQAHVGPAAYFVFGGIQSERAGETIMAMRVKLEELRAGVEFDEVFAAARRKVLKGLLAESTVSSALAGRLAAIATFGQNPDYYDKLTRYVATLSPAQVKALVATELRPENEVLALLGDKDALEKTFTDAGINDVKYIDVAE